MPNGGFQQATADFKKAGKTWRMIPVVIGAALLFDFLRKKR